MSRLTYSEWHSKVNHYLDLMTDHIQMSAFATAGDLNDAAKKIVTSEFGAPLPDKPGANQYKDIITQISYDVTEKPMVTLRVMLGGNYTTKILDEDDTENFIGDLTEHLKYVRTVREELQS